MWNHPPGIEAGHGHARSRSRVFVPSQLHIQFAGSKRLARSAEIMGLSWLNRAASRSRPPPTPDAVTASRTCAKYSLPYATAVSRPIVWFTSGLATGLRMERSESAIFDNASRAAETKSLSACPKTRSHNSAMSAKPTSYPALMASMCDSATRDPVPVPSPKRTDVTT